MKTVFLFLLSCLITGQTFASSIDSESFRANFNEAYEIYPTIPRGLLEGVAFAQTRLVHLSGNNEGCIGLPQVAGVMGLTENGQGYFNNNLIYVSTLSGFTIHEIKSDPRKNILAYANAYSILAERVGAELDDFHKHDQLLKTLSEIPWNKNAASTFALSCFTYEVFRFMNNPIYQTLFEFPAYSINLTAIYGEENLAVLSSSQITIAETVIYNEVEDRFLGYDRSAEYGPALWDAAPACNYSSR